jgi:two-component system response regulator DesR
MSEESRELQFTSLPDSSTSGAPSKYRILIADNRAVACFDLIASLAAIREVEICGRATNARETVRIAKRMTPDLVILGINLRAISGVDTARRIHTTLPGTEVLVVTLHGSQILTAGSKK